MKRLPVDLQSFDVLRQHNCLYVDKTMYIHKMLEQGRYFFISRPRRFGKSLMISTLRCFFENKKELFDDLWIAKNSRWKWEKYPVIQIDFNVISHDTPEEFKESLEDNMENICGKYQMELRGRTLKSKFRNLVVDLSDKTQMPVVVLIDEYDKPIITHLGKGEKALEIAKANRDLLKSFFGVLKGGDVAPVTRFVFITGVSKFSRVSIFSDLNNLIDITMNKGYATMMGYTQTELEACFGEYIKSLAKETQKPVPDILDALKKYYDGYRFSKKDVKAYNPFSILRAFHNLEFGNYWFETGTPTFLVNLLKENNYPIAKIEKLNLDEQIFSVYDLDNLRPEALLFQTGYITIKDVDDYIYSFHYPNQEVKISFLKSLMFSYIPGHGSDQSMFLYLSRYLQKEDFKAFFETITAIFASIPYSIETKRDEAYFHTAFFLMVSASGVNARSEVLTCDGRIDLVMEFSDKIYLIEFKCNQSAKVAISQIKEKGYDKRFKQTGKKIILMGINFDTKKRNLSEWEVL